MHAHQVLAVDMAGKREVICEVPNRPSGLGWLPDGRMLVVSMTDRKLMRLDRDGLKTVADMSKLAPFDCNDMVVDARGHAYVGNFGFDLHKNETPRATTLVMVAPDGVARVVADDMMFPNGMVITPDGKTLIVGETFRAAIDGVRYRRGRIAHESARVGRTRQQSARWNLPRRRECNLGGVSDGVGSDSGEAGRRGARADQGRDGRVRVHARRHRRADAVCRDGADFRSGEMPRDARRAESKLRKLRCRARDCRESCILAREPRRVA